MSEKTPFYYRWWFITICFLTIYFIPVGLILLILRCRSLSKDKEVLSEKVAVYQKQIDQILDDAKKEAERIAIDAKREAERTIAEGKAQADKVRSEAQQFQNCLDKRNQELNDRETVIDQKYNYVKERESKAKVIVEEAQIKADAILDNANRKIQTLQGTIEALKNERDGYGDEYLVPGRTLLDDLADHFGFSNASQEYKDAKARSKTLVKQQKASICDYVEENRRKTACAFVVDAFNGKVDTAISKVKGGENFGKCRQAILDAFMLVNNLGEAFRNARITDEYLKSRQEELRWASVLLELKKQEQEEQREIRERMREEARAQAEFERARKEAEKEEERLRLAQQKMEEALKTATEAQRVKYEAQLQALNERLKQAEENSKRAQSMAELTKAGHVYVISNIGSFGENIFKIGMTRRLDPEDRISELSNASVPFPFDIHAMIYSENAPDLEYKLHDVFEKQRVNMVNPRKEFFRVQLSEIEREVEKLGVKAQFTLLARAEEYRESIRMTEPLKSRI